MSVYYKFKSAKDYDFIPIDGHFISVANLKEKIFESKHLGRGTDFDLVVTNAQTNEEYLDDAMLIPKNTSVLIRRVPGRPRMNIVTEPVAEQDEPKVDNMSEDAQPAKSSSFLGADPSGMKYLEDSEWDEFGNDLYAIPEAVPVQASNPIQDAPPPSKADEDSKIKALIDTPALDWQHQASNGFGPGRGFGRGMGGRMMNGRGFGRGLERKTPPQGYTCHRCKVPGHFIQHCPTNGDPNFDIKRVKPPTGIPKSMLMATPDGSYALPSGAVAVLRPNEAAFEKEIEGLPSTRPVGDLPPELHCPLCKEVMKDAVLTSKCCFNSFCDKCIRDHIISKSMCVCGATNILADDLLPNRTLRDTINRILESNNSSAENAGSAFQAQDMESARCPLPKIPSPTLSAASKAEQVTLPQIEETPKVKETTEHGMTVNAPQQTLEKGRNSKVADVTEAIHGSMSVKEPASQGSAPLPDEEVQQKPVSDEAGKKKKKKKARLPLNATEMQWKASQDFAAENYMMPMGPSAYNPYWTGMQPGMEGYAAPYGAGAMPYMGYGFGPLDVPFGGVLPPDPFGAQGYMWPMAPPPQRDLAEFGMGMQAGPILSREEFEARKADLRRKREFERRGERELFSKEVSSSGDVSSLKPKSQKPIHQTSGTDHHHYRQRSEKPSPERPIRDLEPPRPSSKRKSDYDYHRDHHHTHHRPDSLSSKPPSAPIDPPPRTTTTTTTAADRKQKASVFSRISFPEEEAAAAAAAASKKRKLSSEALVSASASSGHHKATSNGYHEDYKTSSSSLKKPAPAATSRKSASVAVDYDSSDDERHFKRRPSRYEASPPAANVMEWEEEARHSRGSRERERDRGRDGYSKHR
ncbi:E3 ubiquitin ligase PARAQUAT TOLERANCE 3-like isoform X2 [Cornus florida]|uniref:E3 ubiquitin ligase PARAQUAT TOLERANCE 3-like isoform X2 n=1 Tax=Cornus florida TaxID=4283 RepID=UPI0028974742|nr:E3 ubiquitin ligase PARAQUAT TOLERANCE 3-like isoform X2 [Cornus florida]